MCKKLCKDKIIFRVQSKLKAQRKPLVMSSFPYSRITEIDVTEEFIVYLMEQTNLPRDTCFKITSYLPTQYQFTSLDTIKYSGNYSKLQL